MVEAGEDCEDDHDDQWAWGGGDTEKTNEADFSNVDTSHQLLQGTGVYEAFGVDLRVGHEKYVVAECQVEEGHANCSEAQDERSNAGVSDTNNSNVGENWESATPGDCGKVGPFGVHLSWGSSKELVEEVEDDKPNYL